MTILKPKYNLNDTVVYLTTYTSIHQYSIRYARVIATLYKRATKVFEYTLVDVYDGANYHDRVDEKDIFPADAKLLVKNEDVYITYLDVNTQ